MFTHKQLAKKITKTVKAEESQATLALKSQVQDLTKQAEIDRVQLSQLLSQVEDLKKQLAAPRKWPYIEAVALEIRRTSTRRPGVPTGPKESQEREIRADAFMMQMRASNLLNKVCDSCDGFAHGSKHCSIKKKVAAIAGTGFRHEMWVT